MTNFLLDPDSFAATEIATNTEFRIPLDATQGADQATVYGGLQSLCETWGWRLAARP